MEIMVQFLFCPPQPSEYVTSDLLKKERETGFLCILPKAFLESIEHASHFRAI